MSLGKHLKCISFCFRTDHRQLLLVGKPGSSATLASLTEHLGTALSFSREKGQDQRSNRGCSGLGTEIIGGMYESSL